MSRHDRDVLSLMPGLVLVLLAGLFLVVDATELSVQARWVAPVILLVVGCVGLAATLRARTDDEADVPEPVVPEPVVPEPGVPDPKAS